MGGYSPTPYHSPSTKLFGSSLAFRRLCSQIYIYVFDDDSAATLICAFVASRGSTTVSNILLIGAPKKTTDKLQRALNAAVRIVSNTIED